MARSNTDKQLPTPEEMLGWNGGDGVDINTALEYFTAGTRQLIELDNLYPVSFSFDPRERERGFGSYAGIDDFIGALPVKQMYNITRNHLKDRLRFLKVYLHYSRMKLGEHFKRYREMKADKSVDEGSIRLHKSDGFHKKRGYDIFVYLSLAMTVTNVLAKQVGKSQWQQCQCTKCMLYHSREYHENKPDRLPETLPRMRFYRRGSQGISPSEEIYRKQRGDK
ncbi:hypothetical protein DVH05_022759 [Phytophthora capsici]|nr:hypothetical protein DVH05_022759 [Phytophthora capsici]